MMKETVEQQDKEKLEDEKREAILVLLRLPERKKTFSKDDRSLS